MIEAAGDGVLLNVRVIPRFGRSGLAGTRGDALLVRLQSPPVDGAANEELIEVLAKAFRVPKRAVSIVAGAALGAGTLNRDTQRGQSRGTVKRARLMPRLQK